MTEEHDEPNYHLWILVIAISIPLFLFIHSKVRNFLNCRWGGQYTQCQSNCKNIGMALEIYSCDNNGLYPSDMSKLIPKYLKAIPTCASQRGRRGGYGATYRVDNKIKAYSFYCQGENHGEVGAPRNFPQYNSYTGLWAKP